MNTLINDFRFALRTLRKSPGFTAIAILTLGLCIALNSSMFSPLSAWMLRPPPVHDPNSVLVVSSVNPGETFRPDMWRVSAPNYLAWRAQNRSFSDVAAAVEYDNANLTSPGEPQQVLLGDVTANYFSVLGVSPAIGRAFAEGEDRPGNNHVVILSYGFWQREFASDPHVLGRTMRLDGVVCTIAGVMPASFNLLGYPMQMWRPLVLAEPDQSAGARKNRSLIVVARLKPGVTLAQAGADVSALALRAEQDFPDTEKGWRASVRTLEDWLARDFGVKAAVTIMMSALSFILLIGCANIAGLFLARASRRKREMAIRLALGAGRLRVMRQLFIEGFLISVAGGGLGFVLSFWGVDFLHAHINFNPAVAAVAYSVDRGVLGYTIGLSVLCALLCSLAPALQASRTDVNASLKDDSRTASGKRSALRSVFVASEIGLALFLTCGAGFLILSIVHVAYESLGFEPEHVLTANVSLDDAHYHDPARQSVFFQDVVARLEQLPGVTAAAATSELPATGGSSIHFRIRGEPDTPDSPNLSIHDHVVTPGFLHAAAVPLLRGRDFTDSDDDKAPRVLLVDAVFASHFLNGADPIGKVIGLEVGDSAGPVWGQIVGVVGDVKNWPESERKDPGVYEAFAQRPQSAMSLMIRTAGNPDALAPELRRAVWAVDPELPVAQLTAMPALLQQERAGDIFFSQLLAVFALVALLLAGIGIYGVVAFAVAQRTHEIGIRMALGADGAKVMRMVFGESVKLVLIGGGIGLLASAILPKALEGLLEDFQIHGKWFYVVVPVVIGVVAALATYIPARRATRVDPIVALRYE